MASKRSCVDAVHTDRTDSPGATAWVVLLEEAGRTTPDTRETLPARLARHGFSVLRLQPSLHSSRRSLLAAIANGVAALGDEDSSRPFLFAGSGRLSPIAALAAVEHDAAGLLSVDGPLLSVSWRLHRLAGPTLLLGTDAATRLTTGALRVSAATLGAKGRFARDGVGGVAGDRALRDWGVAVDRGAWPAPPLARSRRLALPAAAALLAAPTAIALTATPVGAAQRSGDGVAVAKRTSSPERMLRANKVPHGQRQGDGLLQPHATGSKALIDQAGLKWFINTDITFSTTSSASGANSEASYTHAVPASTLNGGTTSSTLNDAYDGYNTLAMSVNGTVCTVLSQIPAGCTWYNKNGAAATDCNGREIALPTQVIDGLNVSRRNYVPSDDHFERVLNVFNNPTAAPITVTMSILNNLGSDSNTKITGTSSGDATPSTADNWVTTFQNFTGVNTTTSDPRLGHVLEGDGAAVPLSNVTFTNGSDKPFWTYDFTVAPGQTTIIGNFAVADGSIAQSKADSARLDALPPTALECMSQADLANLANFHFVPLTPLVPPKAGGFWLADTNGGLYAFGAGFDGSLPGLHVTPAKPITAMASTSDGKGYWMAGADGGVYSFGDAVFGGSLPGLHVTPTTPVAAMARASMVGGYWLAGADGAIYALGGAPYLGSLPGLHVTPNQPIVGMVSTPDGGGYLLVGADGAVYAFGDAVYQGSLPGLHVTPNQPVVGIAATASGNGYWLVGADGAVYAFGDATFEGSLPGLHVTPSKPIVGITATPSGKGYWLEGADGGTFNFGDATFLGSAVGLTSGHTIVGGAPGA